MRDESKGNEEETFLAKSPVDRGNIDVDKQFDADRNAVAMTKKLEAAKANRQPI